MLQSGVLAAENSSRMVQFVRSIEVIPVLLTDKFVSLVLLLTSNAVSPEPLQEKASRSGQPDSSSDVRGVSLTYSTLNFSFDVISNSVSGLLSIVR